MTLPAHMTVVPRAWQLKGAAQAHANCQSDFRGILLGDSPGLGKTMTAISRAIPGERSARRVSRGCIKSSMLTLGEIHRLCARAGNMSSSLKQASTLLFQADIGVPGNWLESVRTLQIIHDSQRDSKVRLQRRGPLPRDCRGLGTEAEEHARAGRQYDR